MNTLETKGKYLGFGDRVVKRKLAKSWARPREVVIGRVTLRTELKLKHRESVFGNSSEICKIVNLMSDTRKCRYK